MIKGLTESQIKLFFNKYPFLAFFLPFWPKFRNHPTNGHFGWKTKFFFFFENFIKMLKPLWRSIFDQRICLVTNWVFSKKYPPFLPFLTKNSETILQRAILGEKQKNFFFWKLYQNAKNPVAFDFWSKNLLGYKLSFFFNKYPLFCLIFFNFFTAEFGHFLITFS